MGQGDNEQNFAYIKAPNPNCNRENNLTNLMFAGLNRRCQRSNRWFEDCNVLGRLVDKFVFHATRLSSLPYKATPYTDTNQLYHIQNNIGGHLTATSRLANKSLLPRNCSQCHRLLLRFHKQ